MSPAARAHSRAPENRTLGIGLILASTLVFGLSDSLAKLALTRLHPVEVSWMRSLVALVLTLGFAFYRLGPATFATRHPGTQSLRGLAAFGSSILFMTGLSHLSIADNVAINFVWPILVTILSIPLLGEKVGIRRWLAAMVGFAGMLLVIRPTSSSFQAAAIYPFGGACLWALSSVMTRKMMLTERPETTLAWSSVIFLLGASLALPFFWITPNKAELWLGLAIGIGSTLGHAFVVFAFERASASAIAPFGYAQLVWSALFGFLIFHTVPDAYTFAGAGLIAGAGLYTAHRERVRRGEPTVPLAILDVASEATTGETLPNPPVLLDPGEQKPMKSDGSS